MSSHLCGIYARNIVLVGTVGTALPVSLVSGYPGALMRKAIDRSFLTRLLQTTALSLALITASAAVVRAEIVIVQGDDGVNGADGVNPGDPGLPGGDGESVTANAGSSPIPSPE